MEAKLVVIGGKANMGEVKLRLPMTIGRGNKADLMISHPTVSREHCRLFEKNGELVVQDNGSSNGTFVDGEKIVAAVVVQPGQILAIGPLTFRAEYEAPTSNVSSATKSGPLADTQAIDSDELDLDFLLGDDAPAKPAPAKPKAEKKVEAKAPAGVPGKPAKNAPPEAKDKKARGTAPTIQEQTKSTKTTADAEQAPKAAPPAKGVKETAELDVDFLLDDLAEEQKQAPAAKDTSEIDLSDLGLDEPAAKSPNVASPAAKTPAPAPKADDFEQTIDFSGIGDDDEKPAAPPMEDLLPSDDVKSGDVDFDFLSDLDDTKPAAAAKIEEPAEPAEPTESPKIAPPETVASAPVEEPASPAPAPSAANDLDLNDFFSTLDAPAAVAPQEEQSLAPAAASMPTESLEVVSPEPEAEKPEFDFSALSEAQDVAIGPPAAASAGDVSVEIAALESAAPVAEPPAEAPVEEASSPTIPDFDFLAKEEIEAVVDIGPVADSTPDVDSKQASKAADFNFLDDLEAKPAASAEITESPVAEAPVAEAAQPAAEFDFDALVVDEVRVAVEPGVAAPVAEEPNFDLGADLSKAESPAAPEAQGPADDFDFLAAEKLESPAASAPVDETVMFSAAASPVADTPAASAEPAGEFSFDAPATPAEETDFGALEAVEATQESRPAGELDMFTAPTASSDAAAESAPEEESAPIAFAPAAQAAPTGPVARKPAAKGPSFLEKVKLLFGGAKKGPAKKDVAKKSSPAAPAAPTGYQPVVAHPVKPIDAPIPLDDSPISLDDLAPLETAQADAVSPDAAPAENAATELFVGLVSLEATAAETPSVAADVGAPEVAPELTTTEVAASFAPPADVEATAMFAAFAADAPADEASVAPAKESAADAFDDFLSDLGASDASAAVAETSAAAPLGEAAEAKPAVEAAELDFSLDDLTPSAEPEAAAEDQWSLDAPVAQSPITESPITESPITESPITESPITESPITLSPSVESAGAEPPAVDQLELDFLSEEFTASSPEAAAAAPEQPASEPIAEATQEPTSETADLFADVADMEVPAADAASIESIAAEPPVAEAEAPVAEVATPPAPRRPAHIDVDLRLSSSLRPLARVHLQRPRHDVPEMEPEEPAGRCFTPRAKTPSAPVAEPETAGSESTPFEALETPTDASAPADVSASSAEAPAFDGFRFGDDSPTSPTEVAGEPAASLGDADFDFLAKEQEAEAALDITGASPSSEAPVDATADLFADLEAAVASPSVPDSPAGEQEEEFIISLDELSEEPAAEITPSTEGVSEATLVPGALGEVGAAQEAAPADAGVELDFLDLEIVDESPAIVDGREVIDVVEETPAVSTEAEKPAAQPVVAKKAPAEGDEELADFLRDLGMN